jgi:hypothetical protein
MSNINRSSRFQSLPPAFISLALLVSFVFGRHIDVSMREWIRVARGICFG